MLLLEFKIKKSGLSNVCTFDVALIYIFCIIKALNVHFMFYTLDS
jgi:hypothetical protein